METHPTSVSLGVLRCLPAKIDWFLTVTEKEDHLRLRKPERKKIEDLKGSLENKLVPSHPAQPSEVEEPAWTAWYWVKELRELSFDIDDFIDKLLHVEAVQTNPGCEVCRITRFDKCRRRRIVEEVSRFQVRLKGILEHTNNIRDQGSSRILEHTNNIRDQGSSSQVPATEEALAERLRGVEPARLVGIDSSMKDIERWLTGDGEEQLRVVSIVGPCGVGKTTLAEQLYRKLGSQFDCRASVRLSRKPDMKRLLTSILLQIRPHQPPDSFESCHLINTVRAHLQHKRYFIMIDALWASSTWDIVRHALPDDNCLSRVLTTTEAEPVARKCCGHNSKHIFNMEPLSDHDSRKIFLIRATGKVPSEEKRTVTGKEPERPGQLDCIPSEIIRICGGFPLSITATASLKARQQQEEIEHLKDTWSSLSSTFGAYPSTDGMNKILSFCYNNLPDHLKPCMLYLSIYQEDQIIWKDDLTKKWIAEGFIFAEKPKDRVRIAISYFDELVNSGLIQPVDFKYNGEVLSCSVHHMILDLISNKALQENFVTAIGSSKTNTEPADKVRRLSLHLGDAEDALPPANSKFSQVRSMAFFGVFKSLPSIEEFQLLRVLLLHVWSDQDNMDFNLSAVCKLFLLRYLEIACENVTLKETKLEGLQYLETLKIDSRVGNDAPDIVLPSLLHCDTNLPIDIGKMKSLETLVCFDVSSNPANNEESLGKLVKLQDLRLTCSTEPSDNLKKNMELLASVLPKLSNLKSLTLLAAAGSCTANTQEASSSADIQETSSSCDILSSVSSPPQHLERLELSPRICIFSRLPRWIGGLSVLQILKIAVSELSQRDVDTLNQLPKLISLSLHARALENRIIFHGGVFKDLKHFKFTSSALWLYIWEGAMPSVRTLKLGFSARTIKKYSPMTCGFELLKGLQVISAKIWGDGCNKDGIKDAESELEAAFTPLKVNVRVRLVHSIFYRHQGLPTAGEQTGKTASTEDTNTQADSRSTSSMESMSHMPSPGGESCRPADEETRPIMKYVAKQLASISRERENMDIIIEENMEKRPGVLPVGWVLQLQDLVYDIEDFTDMYNRMRAISKRERNKSKRIKWRARTLFHARHIVPLKHRIKSLQKWQNSAISIHGCGISAAASSGPSAGSSPPPYVPQDQQVSMDKPVRELLELLSVSDNQAEQQQRVISIVGCRGMGKTALAAAVYRQVDVRQFDFRAWVAASECNSVGDLLNTDIQDIQRHKRSLVVIDGLQGTRLWYDIQGYFAGTSTGTCIIVTTSIQSVAAACSPERHIYRMGVLGDSESKELFRRKVRSRENCTPAMENALAETLSKCDGLPLAVVSVANYWCEKGQNLHKPGPGAFEAVNRVLMQCYDSVPDHGHRACILSLIIFPKGHYISRKSLIRRWVAEGLAVADVTRSADQVGADRFDELVDRNLIEPVLVRKNCGKNSKVKKLFRVHGLMLDFIINKAVSKEFVTLIREDQPLSNKKGARPIRRLSVHGSTVESGRVVKAIGWDHVRSLTVRQGELFDLQSCHFLRVLDLESCSGVDDLTLHCICKLMLLKYLSLRGSKKVRQIPKNIKRLELLETLDIRETQVKIVPMEVIMLPKLAHLFGHFQLPRELGDDKKRSELEAFFSEKSSLQALSGFVIDGNNSGFELILSHMRFLKKIKISCDHSISSDSEDLMAYSLRKSFARDNGLESLSIDFGDNNSINFLDSVLLEGPCMLSSIKLRGMLSRLPNFITLLGSALSELQLSVTGVSLEDLSVLQYFPGLLYLKLVKGPRAFWGGCFIVKEGGFPSLRRLCFDAPELPEVRIDHGGMSSLTSLHLLYGLNIYSEPRVSSKLRGMHHLKYLNEIVLRADVGGKEIEAWQKEAKGHENRPKVFTVAMLHVRP